MNLVQSVHFIVSAVHGSCIAREASIHQEFTVLRLSSMNGNYLICKVKKNLVRVVSVQGHDKTDSLHDTYGENQNLSLLPITLFLVNTNAYHSASVYCHLTPGVYF